MDQKEERSQTSRLNSYLKSPEKKSKINPKRKIIKIGAEVNEIENRKTMEKINGTKLILQKKKSIKSTTL